MEQFNIGDVVRIKSGGPKMTIIKYSTNSGPFQFGLNADNSPKEDRSKVICEWFDDTTKKQGEFVVASLEKVVEIKKGW